MITMRTTVPIPIYIDIPFLAAPGLDCHVGQVPAPSSMVAFRSSYPHMQPQTIGATQAMAKADAYGVGWSHGSGMKPSGPDPALGC